jgi:hypothetical protein
VRKKTLEDYKKSAPETPANTCPYIDFAKDVMAELKDETSSPLCEQKIELLENILEYIRESNDCLRTSSQYWYNNFKNKFK